MFDADGTKAYFDQYGMREWERLVETPAAEISLHLHAETLRAWVQPGMRVLETGAGAGRFTEILAQIGARVTVSDLSPGQLEINRTMAAALKFAPAVEDWVEADICGLAPFPDSSYDCVVAYGGPFSYVLDRRGEALRACLRVLRPGGLLLVSVMSLWGSAHAALPGVIDLPAEWNQKVTATGDLTAETFPGRPGNFMHLFRAAEVREWLAGFGLPVLEMRASGVLASATRTAEYDAALKAIRENPAKWAELLRMEREASAEPGCLDMGTHLIFVTRRA